MHDVTEPSRRSVSGIADPLMSFNDSNQVEDASLLIGHDVIQEDAFRVIGHVTHAELQRLELVPSKGRAPKDVVWDFAHHIAAKLLQGTPLEAIDVKAGATRFFPDIAKSGGDRDRATKYAKIIARVLSSTRRGGGCVAFDGFDRASRAASVATLHGGCRRSRPADRGEERDAGGA
jgi:hypothetical protein